MDIPIHAKVYCQDKLCGHTQAVILDPVSGVVTHVVVKERKTPHTERLVPVDLIDASLANNIHLRCNQVNFEKLPPFVDVEYIQTSISHYLQATDSASSEAIVIPEKKTATKKHFHLPGHELAVSEVTPVYSADGYGIGKVDEFLVDQDYRHIT